MFWVYKAETSGLFKDVMFIDNCFATEEEAMARMRELVAEGLRAKYEMTQSPLCWAR